MSASRLRARRLFIEAVMDVMKECDSDKRDPDVAQGLKPFIDIANEFARDRKRVRPPKMKVAAE